jgi:hypothetical protein
MIFYRSKASDSSAAGPSVSTLRVLTAVALVAYPAGALVRLLTPEGPSGDLIGLVVGFGLIVLALVAAAPVMGSRLQRIVAEQAPHLDEMEMMMRHKALSWSYGVLGGAVLALFLYAGMAVDAGWWIPSSFDQWNGLFWGAFLYVTLLPTARLAWTMDAQDEGEE